MTASCASRRALSASILFSCAALAAACGSDPPPAGAPDGGADVADAAPPASTRPPGVALCYTSLSSEHPATLAFWDALRGGHPEDRGAVIDALAAAVEQHPSEEELALLHGLAHLWRLAEPLPEEVGDLVLQFESAVAARQELERAYELCPTDHRIPAWLGPVLVRTGQALGDQATIDEGLAVLQQGIDHYPAFVLFSKLLIYADRPKGDPEFQMALAAVEENVDLCTPIDPACTNHPKASHNMEGATVFMGDVIAKAGRRDDALAIYVGAKSVAEYADWDYQALLEERIATIDARVAAYDTPETTDDPEAAWTAANQCSICHRD